MTEHLRGTLQLDFDGTLAAGDVSVGILSSFLSPAWKERVEIAGRVVQASPESTDLIDTMTAGYACLSSNREEYLRFARQHHPPRAGLRTLVETALGLGFECHVVSYGFEFYIREYLRSAGVEGRVAVHAGHDGPDGVLQYLAPNGEPTRCRYKDAWAEHFLSRSDLLVYAGDGASDVRAANLAGIVFARDGLLAGMRETYEGRVYPFENLDDIANRLGDLV